MPCSSAGLLTQVTHFRNAASDNFLMTVGKRIAAETVYIIVVPYSLFEAAISQLVKAITTCFDLDPDRRVWIAQWADNSTSCFMWACRGALLNLFTRSLPTSQIGYKLKTSMATVLPTLTPEEKKLLSRYELGKHALTYSKSIAEIHNSIPTFTDEELKEICNRLNALFDAHNAADPDNVQLDGTSILSHVGNAIAVLQSEKIAHNEFVSEWEKRFVGMVLGVLQVIEDAQANEGSADEEDEQTDTNSTSAATAILVALVEAGAHCKNRQSTELEKVYVTYAVPHLQAERLRSLTARERLKGDFMEYRAALADSIVRTYCDDEHGAASTKFYRKRLNESVFLLPPAPLSSIDDAFEEYAMKRKEPEIIQAFRDHWYNPAVVYDQFKMYVHPEEGDTFGFKQKDLLDWLKEQGISMEDAYTNEDYTTLKPKIMISYLRHNGFLVRKAETHTTDS